MSGSGRRVIELTQYVERAVELTDAQAGQLAGRAKNIISVSPTSAKDRWALRAKHHIGTLVVGDCSFLIRPKIPPQNVFVMFDIGLPENAWHSEQFGYGTEGELLPAVVAWFARNVERTLGRGLIRNYRHHEDELVAIRGRIDVPRMLARGGLALPVACQFDEFSADTAENRYLKSAIKKALRIPGVDAPTRQKLRKSLGKLGEVSDARVLGEQRFRYTRLNERYRPALRLARLIHEHVSLIDRAGTVEAASFLVDMNTLFERFVTERLRKLLRGHLEVVAQSTKYLDEERRIEMRPDLVFRRQGVPVLVGDTKYKIARDAQGRSADYYQMLAYTTAMGLNDAVLIYCQDPDHEGPIESTMKIKNTPKHLHLRAINLSGTPSEIEIEMLSFVESWKGQV